MGLWISACQTGHPGPLPIAGAVELPKETTAAAPVEPLPAPVEPLTAPASPAAAAIDPLLERAEQSVPAEQAEEAWIDALLQRRAPRLDRRHRAGVARAVTRAAEDYGLDPLVVLSVIAHESRFDPHARGPAGGTGLMQLRAFVARDVAQRYGLEWRGDHTLLDPACNVAIGTAYLSEMLQEFGDLDLALTGYNMGPNRLQRMLARGSAPAGRYVGGVLSHYTDLAGLAASLETGPSACTEAGC